MTPLPIDSRCRPSPRDMRETSRLMSLLAEERTWRNRPSMSIMWKRASRVVSSGSASHGLWREHRGPPVADRHLGFLAHVRIRAPRRRLLDPLLERQEQAERPELGRRRSGPARRAGSASRSARRGRRARGWQPTSARMRARTGRSARVSRRGAGPCCRSASRSSWPAGPVASWTSATVVPSYPRSAAMARVASRIAWRDSSPCRCRRSVFRAIVSLLRLLLRRSASDPAAACTCVPCSATITDHRRCVASADWAKISILDRRILPIGSRWPTVTVVHATE